MAFLGLTVAATLRVPYVEAIFREIDLAYLLTVPKHLAGVVAAAAVLDFIAWLVGRGHDLRGRRTRITLAAVTATVMLWALPFVPRSSDGDFALGGGGSIPILIYWGAWLAHLGIVLAMASGLFLRQARQAPAGRLRYGLAIGGAGTIMGLFYVANKALFMILGFTPGIEPPFTPDFTTLLNSLLLNLSLFLVIIGTTLPADFVASALERVNDLRALHQLRPLWKAIHLQNPDVVLEIDTNPRWYERRFWDTRLRLYRYTIEIRDGVLALREHTQDRVDDVARRAAAASSTHRADIEAFVQACQWSVALHAKARGIPGVPGSGDRHHGGGDLDHEVCWLRRVARAYRSPAVRELSASFFPHH